MREAHALARRHPYLDEVTLYRGVLDLKAILPREDVMLIAPAAQIVVREDLHPAIQSLLIEGAMAAHGGGSLLSDPGQFPAPQLADIAISDEAKRYYDNGPSFLRRVFPYSVANFLERAWVLAIPLITLMIPLIRAAPPLYRWRIRRKIYVWYNDLRQLEADGRAATSPEARAPAAPRRPRRRRRAPGPPGRAPPRRGPRAAAGPLGPPGTFVPGQELRGNRPQSPRPGGCPSP
jgi:hypothetical protein